MPQRKRKGYVKGEGKAPGVGGACQAAYATIERAAREKLGGKGSDGEPGSENNEGAGQGNTPDAADVADADGDGDGTKAGVA